jgi:TRAP transporter 4TM/12TM fusion protein
MADIAAIPQTDRARNWTWLDVVIALVAIGMSLYHLHIAYTGGYEPLYQRSLSYLFGLTLVFLIYAPDHGWRRYLSFALALLSVVVLYYTVESSWRFVRRLQFVNALPTMDIVAGTIVILLTLEASRRAINNALPIIAVTFILYTLFGQYFPWEFAHAGSSYAHMIELQYTLPVGLWSTAMNTFTVYIFLFILFGAFLERLGAADIYVRLAVAAAGQQRGGPAKAAIFASAMTGTITGSANANIVTTGTITIPLMKRAGFKPEVAAGIETAASTGGQIMPPVMGAAAFLIVEFTGISYWEIVKVSILPAVLYFFSVFMMVHFEAVKEGLKGLPRDLVPRVWPILKEGGIFLIPPILIFVMIMYRWSVPQAGLAGIASVVLLAGLKGLWDIVKKASRQGVGISDVTASAAAGVGNVLGALERGARQSVPICAAVVTVGIVIGAMLQTGLGVKFSSIVISLAQGSLFLGIMLVGVASFVLGMGLPTTAAYIVLSVMAVPAMLDLGEGVGLSLLAAHLIVFWYSLDSNFTPPVCVPAYTAGGIADANASKAAWAAFRTAKGMYVIPLLFAYTPLLNFDDPLALAATFIAAMFGFYALSAVMVGQMIARLNWVDRTLLLGAAGGLFWPGVDYHIAGLVLLLVSVVLQRRRSDAPLAPLEKATRSAPEENGIEKAPGE